MDKELLTKLKRRKEDEWLIDWKAVLPFSKTQTGWGVGQRGT